MYILKTMANTLLFNINHPDFEYIIVIVVSIFNPASYYSTTTVVNQ